MNPVVHGNADQSPTILSSEARRFAAALGELLAARWRQEHPPTPPASAGEPSASRPAAATTSSAS